MPRNASTSPITLFGRRRNADSGKRRRKSEHGFAERHDAFDRFGFSGDDTAQHGHYGRRESDKYRRFEAQQFFDNGTNGDVTAGDNIYSYLATIPGNQPGGQISVTAVASDAQARSANVTINLTINAPIAGRRPADSRQSDAMRRANVANENNYLMIKPQYSLSYNRSQGEPNWVAWRLDQHLDRHGAASG